MKGRQQEDLRRENCWSLLRIGCQSQRKKVLHLGEWEDAVPLMRTKHLGESFMGVVKMKNEGDLQYLWLAEEGRSPVLVWVHKARAPSGVTELTDISY